MCHQYHAHQNPPLSFTDSKTLTEWSAADDGGNSFLHLVAEHNHMKSAELYLSFLEESDRNRVLGQRNSKRKTPYNLAKKKRMKALLSWAQKEKGFYLLTTPPVVLVMYQTKVCFVLTPLATKRHKILSHHYSDCPVFHCNDFYLSFVHMRTQFSYLHQRQWYPPKQV